MSEHSSAPQSIHPGTTSYIILPTAGTHTLKHSNTHTQPHRQDTILIPAEDEMRLVLSPSSLFTLDQLHIISTNAILDLNILLAMQCSRILTAAVAPNHHPIQSWSHKCRNQSGVSNYIRVWANRVPVVEEYLPLRCLRRQRWLFRRRRGTCPMGK